MNNLTKGLITAVIMTVASTGHSAVFVKYDGVDGESKEKPAAQQVDSGKTAKPAALLLPAVQSAREAAARNVKPADGSARAEHEKEIDILDRK